jgi:hypothetical protein
MSWTTRPCTLDDASAVSNVYAAFMTVTSEMHRWDLEL